jgi:carbon monoxide dehydrogenase subunit G
LFSVAVKASREFVVDAPPEVVMEALGDVSVLPSWSPLHKDIEVIDCYPDGRPHHVKGTTLRVMGLVDKEVLEFHWGPHWVVWDAQGTSKQHDQHVEYNLKPEGVDKTRVRFDVTIELGRLIPGFIVKRATEVVLNAAEKGLTDLVARGGDSGKAKN